MKAITISFSKECIPYHNVRIREYLENLHTFEYNETTRVTDLFRFLINESGFSLEEASDGDNETPNTDVDSVDITDDVLIRLFVILHENESYSLWNPDTSLDKLFTYLRIQDNVELYFETSFGGEGAFDEVECEGIQFYFHSDENVHWGRPHIHAKKGEKQITIDLNTFELLAGHFRKKKHENKAIECVKAHQLTFMKGWNDHSNGIRVNLDKYFDLASNA